MIVFLQVTVVCPRVTGTCLLLTLTCVRVNRPRTLVPPVRVVDDFTTEAPQPHTHSSSQTLYTYVNCFALYQVSPPPPPRTTYQASFLEVGDGVGAKRKAGGGQQARGSSLSCAFAVPGHREVREQRCEKHQRADCRTCLSAAEESWQ